MAKITEERRGEYVETERAIGVRSTLFTAGIHLK
jgi:hypothetical protein